MGTMEPIPVGFDDEGNVITINSDDIASNDYAAVKIFIAAVNVGHKLVYSNQTEPNSTTYTDWTPIDDNTYMYEIDCSTTLDGFVSIAAVDSISKTVQYITENPEGNNDKLRWLPREDLGLPKGMKEISSICLGKGSDGLDGVIVSELENGGGTTWWKYRNPPVIVEKKISIVPPGATEPIEITVRESEPPAKPWSDWTDITGSLKSGFRKMHITNNADGALVLCGNQNDTTAWVRQQDSKNPSDPSKWSDWIQPGGAPTSGAGAELAKPILDSTGRVSIFANFDGVLRRSGETGIGTGEYGPWSAPGIPDQKIGEYSLSIDGDDCIYIGALNITDDNELSRFYTNRETDADHSIWGGWDWSATVPNNTFNIDGLAVTYSADGSLTAFMLDSSTSTLYTLNQVALNSTEWYALPVEIGKHIVSFALTRDMTP